MGWGFHPGWLCTTSCVRERKNFSHKKTKKAHTESDTIQEQESETGDTARGETSQDEDRRSSPCKVQSHARVAVRLQRLNDGLAARRNTRQDRIKQPHRPQQTPAYHTVWARTSIGPRQTLCLSPRLDVDGRCFVEVLSTVLGVHVGKPLLQAGELSSVGHVLEPAELYDQQEVCRPIVHAHKAGGSVLATHTRPWRAAPWHGPRPFRAVASQQSTFVAIDRVSGARKASTTACGDVGAEAAAVENCCMALANQWSGGGVARQA